MTWRRFATAALVVVLALPLLVGFDDLPLSRYPMYAMPRASQFELVVAHGVDAGGGDVELSITTVAATRDPLVVESWLRDAVRQGRADATCSEIAARIDDPSIERIELRTEVHDLRARASGESSLRAVSVEATCAA